MQQTNVDYGVNIFIDFTHQFKHLYKVVYGCDLVVLYGKPNVLYCLPNFSIYGSPQELFRCDVVFFLLSRQFKFLLFEIILDNEVDIANIV